MLSPFTKMKGLYFNNDGEPDELAMQLQADIDKIVKGESGCTLAMEFDSKDEYYDVMNYIQRINDGIEVYGVLRDKPAIVIKKEDDVIAEHERSDGNPTEDMVNDINALED